MIKDLQLMRDISPLFEKQIIIWGMGQRGHRFLKEILSMGAGKRGIWLCDSSPEICESEDNFGYSIFSPEELQKELSDAQLSKFIILVTTASLQFQDEIINYIEEQYGAKLDIYTDYAIEWGIYLNIHSPYVEKAYRSKKLSEREKSILPDRQRIDKELVLRYFAFAPLHNDEIILVYQCGKVGSTTVSNSIRAFGRNVLHCHTLTDIGENDDDLYKVLNLKSGKIICLVRDPVAKAIAAMWECVNEVERYSREVDFQEIERYFLSKNLAEEEFKWFDEQMKKYFQIDVFQYPFDQEKGYSIIKKENIELLLMKLEKLNELEEVIGEFLSMKGFRLYNTNIGLKKAYRFAIQEYKETVNISQEQLEDVYIRNARMQHFYTEKERHELYLKWLRNGKGEMVEKRHELERRIY